MKKDPRRPSKDYSTVFLGGILFGIVMVVLGVVLVLARSGAAPA